MLFLTLFRYVSQIIEGFPAWQTYPRYCRHPLRVGKPGRLFRHTQYLLLSLGYQLLLSQLMKVRKLWVRNSEVPEVLQTALLLVPRLLLKKPPLRSFKQRGSQRKQYTFGWPLKKKDKGGQSQDGSLLEDNVYKRLRITGLTRKKAEISLPPCVWVIGHFFTYPVWHIVLQATWKKSVG